MPWNDRIREAAFTSAGGSRFVFTYEDVARAFDRKTTGFNFPDADGTYVQDLGHTGYRFPMRVIFWGDDYDIESQAFEDGLLEKGTGKLEHPIYGVKNVVPFGSVTRRDDLKTGGNQAIIEVVFWETIGLIYPSSQQDPGSQVLISVEEFNAAISEEFEQVVKTDTEFKRVTLGNTITGLIGQAKSNLDAIVNTQDDVRRQFNNIYHSITNSIDILIGDPLTLAFQTVLFIQSPARAFTNITDRIDAYSNLLDTIINGNDSVVMGEPDDFKSNDFHAKDLNASTYLTGNIVSVVNNEFTTKPEALQAAELILTQLDEITNWRDANFEALNEIDTGGSYQKLLDSAALAAGFLVEISFTLKQERSVVIDRDRTIIDLCAELYGTVDDDLDFLIKTNNLSGSEILEIQKGREIVYYV